MDTVIFVAYTLCVLIAGAAIGALIVGALVDRIHW